MNAHRVLARARIVGLTTFWGSFATLADGQTTYYVDAHGANDGNCLAWATACRDLQTALEMAQSGDQIWMADGVYRPTRRTDPTDPRTATLGLISGVAIYGGFSGGETNLDQRNPALHVARLTGVLDDANAGFAFHVITSIGVGPETIVDGVTITDGRADGVCCGQDRGGGVFNSGGSPNFIGCSFRDNFGLIGGAVYSSQGSPSFRNCSFYRNAAGAGGGVHLALNSAITISGCHFEDNEASTNGGGLDFRQGSLPLVRESEFFSNRAALGGAIFEIQTHGEVDDSYFESNRAVRGGALYGGGEPGVKVTGCTFVANRADEEGGAARVHGRQDFDRCTFLGNRAEIRGGALLFVGTDPIITNSVFSGNQAQLAGGAISVDASTLYIINSTLNRNHAMPINDSGTCCTIHNSAGCSDAVCQAAVCAWDHYCCSTFWDAACVDKAFAFGACDCGGPPGFGGGVHLVNQSRVTFSSSIVWRSQDSGGFDESAQIDLDATSTVIIDYTCVEGLTGSLGGVGNIGSVPLFVDARGPDLIAGTLDDNLRLKKESPCINAGHVDGEPKSSGFDLDGLPRVLCGRIDMGAYEFGFGDVNCSGTVNLVDFAAWMDCFEGPIGGMSPSCAAFDANLDSRIDQSDLRSFQNVFQP